MFVCRRDEWSTDDEGSDISSETLESNLFFQDEGIWRIFTKKSIANHGTKLCRILYIYK